MTKYFSQLFLLTVFGVAGAFAQEMPCSLQINVFEFGNAGALVGEVKVTLTETEKKSKLKAEPQTDAVWFANLSSGKYKIETSKNGFQRRVKEIYVDCGIADKDGKIFENLYLWKGDAKQETKFSSENTFRAVGTGESFEKFKVASDKDVESSALQLVQPAYPAAARAVRAAGTIPVQVMIDEDGNVISAQAAQGHPLLRAAAVKAARQSKFKMTLLSGVPVKIIGIISYNFIAQ